MDELPPFLQKAVSRARTKHYPRGQIVLYQGDVPADVLVLQKGTVKIYDLDRQGNEKILHLLRPHSLLPFAFFSGEGQEMRWYYAALTDCDISAVPAEKLRAAMAEDSGLTLALMSWFSLEMHELLVRLSSFGKTNTRDKVVAALKFLAVCHAAPRRSGWRRVVFPVNHQLLADLTGVTRESASTIMRELQQHHFVRNPRQTILEIDLERLPARK